MSDEKPTEQSTVTQALPETFCVEIVHTDSQKVIQRMGPMSHRKAVRVECGATINLNHEAFHTRIVEAGR